MTNPFKPHTMSLFADRDSIDSAMEYAHMLLNTLDGPDATAATTALMVVVNTAAKLWPEAPAPAPAPAPVILDAADLGALRSRIAALEERVAVVEVTPEALASEIEAWAEESFNDRADEWLNSHADLDNEIETWMENNFDLEDEVQEVLRTANLRISF